MKYQNKKFTSGYNSKKYRDNWEETFGKSAETLGISQKELNEQVKVCLEIMDEIVSEEQQEELRERGYSQESIDKIIRGLRQSSNGEVYKVNFGDICDDCGKHLSECDCEEETDIERANRLQDLGDRLFRVGKYVPTGEERNLENKKRWEEYLGTDDLDDYIMKRAQDSKKFSEAILNRLSMPIDEGAKAIKQTETLLKKYGDIKHVGVFNWVILKMKEIYRWFKNNQ